VAEAKRKRETPARRKIRAALRALGYEPRSIEWNGAWVLVDWGSDGGFSVDGFGSFASADDFVDWINQPGNFDVFASDVGGPSPLPASDPSTPEGASHE
jgi:hypothetical protein